MSASAAVTDDIAKYLNKFVFQFWIRDKKIFWLKYSIAFDNTA